MKVDHSSSYDALVIIVTLTPKLLWRWIVGILLSDSGGNTEILHEFLEPAARRIPEIYGFNISRPQWRLGWCFCSEVRSRVSLLARYGHNCPSKAWLNMYKLEVTVRLWLFCLCPVHLCVNIGCFTNVL